MRTGASWTCPPTHRARSPVPLLGGVPKTVGEIRAGTSYFLRAASTRSSLAPGTRDGSCAGALIRAAATSPFPPVQRLARPMLRLTQTGRRRGIFSAGGSDGLDSNPPGRAHWSRRIDSSRLGLGQARPGRDTAGHGMHAACRERNSGGGAMRVEEMSPVRVRDRPAQVGGRSAPAP